MKTRVVSLRLTEDVLEPYAELAELTGVPVASVIRETVEEAAPSVRDLVAIVAKAKAGDPAGLLASMRALAENQVRLGTEVGAELAEIENEHKVKRAKKGVASANGG